MRGGREAWRDEPASGTCRLAPCRAGGWRRTGVPGGRMTAHGCGSLLQTECLNYIRVLQPLGPGALYVCGTNAFQPACDHLVRLCPAPCPPPLPLSPATSSRVGTAAGGAQAASGAPRSAQQRA